MAKHWTEVKDKIEAEIDKVWFDEPEEIKMSRLGIWPSGAGTHGSYLGNLFFLVGDTQAMGWSLVSPAMAKCIKDDNFTVENCKNLWRYLFVHKCNLMGAVIEPGCPAPWLNLGTLKGFCDDILDCLDTVQTKEDFADLMWSWFNYIDAINRWAFAAFPWKLTPMFQRVDGDYVAALSETFASADKA